MERDDRDVPIYDDSQFDDLQTKLLLDAGRAAPTVLGVLLQLAERKLFILKFVLCSVVLGLIVAFGWPVRYTAVARIMPPREGEHSLASALLGELGDLGPLASLASGVREKNPSAVYVYMLKSRAVADRLIDQFSLMQVYREKKRVHAQDDLRDNTRIKTGDEGGISISVTDRDPKRAADIANAYVDDLKALTQTLAVSEAGRRRIFFEHQVEDASSELTKAESAMKETQERTGILMLQPQSVAMLESLASVQAEVAGKEAQVAAMRSFAADGNPDLKRNESELAAMKTELARLQAGRVGPPISDFDMRRIPEKGLEYVRALRELKYREGVYEAMVKQYEVARVDEARDAAVIQFLDKAYPPEIRSSPKRALVLITAPILGFLLACLIVVAVERAKADEAFSANLQMLKRKALRRPEA